MGVSLIPKKALRRSRAEKYNGYGSNFVLGSGILFDQVRYVVMLE